MVTDGQVRRLLRELDSGTSLASAARRAGMSDKTAREYRDHRTLPSARKQSRLPRTYRTRPDPFAEVCGKRADVDRQPQLSDAQRPSRST